MRPRTEALVDAEDASQRVKGECALDAARLAIVHVASHSRQRHKVMTVIVLASVSTRLPWQNGHAVGLSIASFNRDSGIVVPQLCVYRTLTFSARGPFGPWPTANETD
jgi:hypothetical protein